MLFATKIYRQLSEWKVIDEEVRLGHLVTGTNRDYFHYATGKFVGKLNLLEVCVKSTVM